MKPIALLILVPLVAACDVQTRKPAEGDENVTMSADESGQVSFNMPFASGKVKLPASAMENSNFDIDGVKLMPGATMTGFDLDADDKGATVNLAFKAPASPEQVQDYFLGEFKKKGVEAAASGSGISGKSESGDDFTIDVQPAAQGSTGTIRIQSDK